VTATCGGCAATWTGFKVAHCSACHRTFTTPAGFDQHRARRYDTTTGERVMVRDYGRCYDPADTGMTRNDRGQWMTAGDGRDWDAHREGHRMTESDETAPAGVRVPPEAS
jgi:hypothetical protein